MRKRAVPEKLIPVGTRVAIVWEIHPSVDFGVVIGHNGSATVVEGDDGSEWYAEHRKVLTDEDYCRRKVSTNLAA